MKSTGFNPQFTITNRITAGLTRIERARGFLEAATLSEEWVREMGSRALMLEAHHTTHIEGTLLTLDKMISKNRWAIGRISADWRRRWRHESEKTK
jgi:hypothetical protein